MLEADRNMYVEIINAETWMMIGHDEWRIMGVIGLQQEDIGQLLDER